jgi:hypothetical protein
MNMDTTITIKWHDHTTKIIPCHSIENGLAVHREYWGYDIPIPSSKWAITHIPSGKQLIGNLPDMSTVLLVLNDLLDTQIDWTLGEDTIKDVPHRIAEARNIVRLWEGQIYKKERGLA